MAEVITMPRLSDTMEEGKVAKWHFKVGDKIKEGDVIAEIETDKAVQDFESEYNGTLLYVGVEEGSGSKVDSILAIIGDPGENIQNFLEMGDNYKPFVDIANGNVQLVNETNPGENEMIDAGVPNDIPNVEVITMPRLSDTMEEGKVIKWHYKVGDTLKAGDILAEIETDKAVQDFENEYNGTLLYIGVEESNSAKVDSILAIIGEKGTDISAIVSPSSSNPKPEVSKKEVVETKTTPVTAVPPSTTEKTDPNKRILASPLAKKLAKEKGYDLAQIKGTGDHGRITKTDVQNWTPTLSPSLSQTTISSSFQQGTNSETPNSQIRTIIAKRLSESKFTAPHYYLMVELNMDNAIKSREEINQIPDTKISFNDLIIKASAMALRKHPQVNSSWGNDKIIHHGDINIGVAVAIEDGLVVPVVKHADFMSLTEISSKVKDLAGRARERKLKVEEMEGSTFSISNLGMFGIESFTSIINQPNSAILSVGAIIEKPVVKDGQVVPGHTMKLSMACDHRVIDGATGAQFLQTLRTYIENPVTILA